MSSAKLLQFYNVIEIKTMPQLK